MIDTSKLERQYQGADIWGRYGRGTLEYIMGFGKTNTGLIIDERMRKTNPNTKTLILVPSATVRDVWYKAIAEFGISEFAPIAVFSVQEYLNLENKGTYDLLIVDEIHKFISDERYTIFKLNNYGNVLGLTGTYPTKREDKEKLDIYCPVIDYIGEAEALQKKWISNFVEYNLALELSPEDKVRYEKYSIPIRETLELFKGSSKLLNKDMFRDDYDVLMSCHAGKKIKTDKWNGLPPYIKAHEVREAVSLSKGWSNKLDLSSDYNKMIEDNWNPNSIERTAREFSEMVRERNNILVFNNVKLGTVIDIFRKFQLSTICFNESTEFADNVAANINEVFSKFIAICFHTNIEAKQMFDMSQGDYIRYKSGAKKGEPQMFGQKRLKDNAINGMISGEYKFLSTARALDEGLNIPNIEMVITTAGTANPIQYKQRKARGNRIDYYNPNKVTKIINLYFDNFIGINGNNVISRDRTKLLTRQKDSTFPILSIKNISDIE